MKKIIYSIFALGLSCLGVACSDNTNIGNSLSEERVEVVTDSSFVVTGHSEAIPRVKARTILQLLGAIKADQYGVLESDIVTEMMPSQDIDTTYVTEDQIYGARLVMFINARTGLVGDSIVPMNMSVYELNKTLPTPIYSDFNPAEYTGNLLASNTYTAADIDKPSSERVGHFISYTDASYSTKYYEVREARVDLPAEIGRKIFREYKNNPSTFKSPEAFVNFFPGFYIKNRYGSGRVMNFRNTMLEVMYKRKFKNTLGNDTIVADSSCYLATTPEVVSNNIIRMNVDEAIKNEIAAGGALLVAPQGYQVDLKLPIKEIMGKYQLDKQSLRVVNSLKLVIPVETVATEYGLTPPTNVLLIRSSEKDKFFNENQLTDGKRSYIGTYDSSTKSYVFSGLRNYLIDILNSGNDVCDEDEYLSLIPVDVTEEQVASTYSYYYSSSVSNVLTKVAPMVSRPAIARLNLKKATINLTYTKQSK